MQRKDCDGGIVTLLPPNATKTERSLEAATARIGEIPITIGDLWNPQTCPTDLLPWLAWALSVDFWDSDWPEERKRAAIAASIDWHRHKGTKWAVVRALEIAGYGTARIQEVTPAALYNGALPRNGSLNRANADHWAEYRIILDKPITIAQAATLRSIVEGAAPARCRLKVLEYTRALNLFDAQIARNGTNTRGVA